MRIDRDYQREWVFFGRVVVGVLLVFFLDLGGKASWIRGGMEIILTPIRFLVSDMSGSARRLSNNIIFWKSGAVSLLDNERRMAEYAATVSRVSELEKENEKLREQLNILSDEETYKEVEIVTIGSDYLVVSYDGEIYEGANVIWGGSLVGIMGEVGIGYARVNLISGVNNKIKVELIDASARQIAYGEVGSDSGYGLVVDNVENYSNNLENLLVVTEGGDGIVGKGYILGRVIEDLSDDSSVYKRGVIDTLYNPEIGDYLFVVTGEEER